MPQKLLIGTAGTPVQFATTLTNYRTLRVIACKGLSGPTVSPNAARVNVGNSPTNNQQPLDMSPGMERSFDAAAGKQEDMTKWWLQIQTTGDGVVLIWS